MCVVGGVNHGMESLIKNEAAAGYNWTLTDTPLTGTEQNIIKKTAASRTSGDRRRLTNSTWLDTTPWNIFPNLN